MTLRLRPGLATAPLKWFKKALENAPPARNPLMRTAAQHLEKFITNRVSNAPAANKKFKESSSIKTGNLIAPSAFRCVSILMYKSLWKVAFCNCHTIINSLKSAQILLIIHQINDIFIYAYNNEIIQMLFESCGFGNNHI